MSAISLNKDELKAVSERKDIIVLRDMSLIQLQYLHYILANKIEDDFYKALTYYTAIAAKMKSIKGFDEQCTEWIDIIKKVKSIYSRAENRKEFAQEAFIHLMPFLTFAETSPKSEKKWFGCFCYNLDSTGKHVYLHFKNACIPDSPFDIIQDRVKDLHDIIDDISKNQIFPETIGCDSWINELKQVQMLFPESYLKSFKESPSDSKSGYGWWGQFINKDGTLNRHKAEKFENDMEFKYKRIIARCGYSEFKTHIKKLIESEKK